MPTAQALHLFITGRVQGVGYRYATYKKANELGLSGWVKNLPDGRVEAWIEGAPDSQNQLLTWCHQGPAFAHVIDIETHKKAPKNTYDSFSIH